MKKLGSILTHRITLTGLAIVLQLAVLAVGMTVFSQYFIPLYWCATLLSLAAVLWIVSSNTTNSGYKIAWIILILSLPVLGGLLYLLSRGNRFTPSMRRRLQRMERSMEETLREDLSCDAVTARSGTEAGAQARYLERYAHCPAYPGSQVTYYPVGDACFQPMLEALRSARQYIFIEYFIIQPGEFWGAVLDILKEKAAAGVDVRVIYDDIGCMFTLPSHYDKELEHYGIRCVNFNRFVPVVSSIMNNRDHRKIMSVDGKVVFTGGVNLADEYINRRERFGHWKDSAIRIEGPAAWSMSVMFLTMWSFTTRKGERIEDFRPKEVPQFPGRGWVQPYTDCPWDDEPVGETVYLNLFSRAREYIYITTPYLIIDEVITTSLVNAAKAGVDVRIVTPHIPDKKLVFQMTRAHYEPLIRGGVKIYEYTPGFVHGKNVAVDDRYGTVGSVNLDYRSLFLHFENGALLIDDPAVLDIKKDFLETLEQCRQWTLEDCRNVPWPQRLIRSILRIFSPLL